MCFNHPELVLKHITHLAISVMVFFVLVQQGSMHKHPTHLVLVWFV